jgi:hypothetical protein
MPFHQGNMMSNKPHLRPHQKERRARQITRLFVAILILAFFAVAIALEMTGHLVFRGRLILGCCLRRGGAHPIAAGDRHRHQGVKSLSLGLKLARLAVRHLQEHKNRQDAERLAMGDT